MSLTPEDVVARLADRPGTAWLDGAGDGWSIVAWDPVDWITDATGWPDAARRLGGHRNGELPFEQGVIGYVAYGAGPAVAPVPRSAETSEPPVWLARYEGALCFRHADATWHLGGSASFRQAAARLLDGCSPLGSVTTAPPPRRVRTMPRATWEARVRRVLAWIGEGDCYQVNLSRAVHLDGTGPAFDAYRRLHRMAHAPYGAFLRPSSEVAILSGSPELLLSADGRAVASVPIKGTRARHPDPVVDHALAGELRTSEKDRAELTMIVDLVRNDLGQIARTGSVRWDRRRLTAHANVHHAAQIVSADLADGQDAWSALAALFPAGSVTGAPKIRACQRIAELEDEPRGVYCGAIGYQSGDRARWNVAIRTGVWTSGSGGAIRYHVGGGIVADSDPTDEWWETVHKGTAMARAFAGVPHPEDWVDESDGIATPPARNGTDRVG